MTRTIEIEVLDHRRGPRIKKIRAEYISAPEVKRRRANLKIAYSRPDFWALGEDLIVYKDLAGEWLYTTILRTAASAPRGAAI